MVERARLFVTKGLGKATRDRDVSLGAASEVDRKSASPPERMVIDLFCHSVIAETSDRPACREAE
jgi:hypothetical protein